MYKINFNFVIIFIILFELVLYLKKIHIYITCIKVYYDPTRMKVFGKNNWGLFDVVLGIPYFQMYNFELTTKIKVT